jgi:hypothetical protein
MKIQAICYSETLVDIQRTTRRYIQDNGSLQVGIKFCRIYNWINVGVHNVILLTSAI